MWPCTLLPPIRIRDPSPPCKCSTPVGRKGQVATNRGRLGTPAARSKDVRSGLLPFRERGLIRAHVRHQAILSVYLSRLDDPVDLVHEPSVAPCLVGGGVLLVRRHGATGEKSSP